MKKILLSAIVVLGIMACGDSTGSDSSSVDYSTQEINKERLLDKTATWVMDASIASAFNDSTLPEEVLLLTDSKPFSTYLSKGSLTIKFENEGEFAIVDYTDELGKSDQFYFNSISFGEGSFTLSDVTSCDVAFTNSICEKVPKVITGKMTEDYLVLSGSPFLKNDPNWGGIELFKRVQ